MNQIEAPTKIYDYLKQIFGSLKGFNIFIETVLPQIVINNNSIYKRKLAVLL